MKSLVAKIYFYWRNLGTKALIDKSITALKAKLFSNVTAHTTIIHATKKNNAEKNYDIYFKQCMPLNVYLVAQNNICRINIVIDSLSDTKLHENTNIALVMGALLAQKRKASLRIIARAEYPKSQGLDAILKAHGIDFQNNVEFIFACFDDDQYQIDYTENELFITTSWWTTASTMSAIPHHAIIYLLQEDERMHYSYSDYHLRCEEILRTSSIRFIISTKLLYDHFLACGFNNIKEHGIWFEPAFSKELFYPRKKIENTKRKLIFYANPDNLQNLYYFGIHILNNAIMQGIIDLAQWNILFIGKNIPNINFASNYAPQKHEDITYLDYANLISQADLGLCLMYTPHPGYPVLELAASGAVVITNKFANKCSMEHYSKNIMCSTLELNSMLEILAQGINLTNNSAQQTKNWQLNNLNCDWHVSFAPILKYLEN